MFNYLFMYHCREIEKIIIRTWNIAEFRESLPLGIPWNSAEFNTNSDGSSEIRKYKLPAEFSTDGIPCTPAISSYI